MLTVGLLSACTPEPEPTPTPTAAFASEEEAFAAAEEVYRQYNDAGNAQRNDPTTESDPQDYLIGSALEGYLEGREYLRSLDQTLVGDTRVLAFLGSEAQLEIDSATVTATVCLDVSETRVLNSDGTDVTPESRPQVVSQQVVMIATGPSFLISTEAQGEAELCK